MSVLKRLVFTNSDGVALLQRLVLAIVMFPHGAQKLLGWFGGFGYAGTMGFFTSQGIPAPFAFLAIMAESVGAVLLFLGLFGRLGAFGILVNMVVAVLAVHLHNGFFMNWMGKAPGEGYEYHLLAIALALGVILRGSGAWSVDRLFSRAAPAREAHAASPAIGGSLAHQS